MTQDMSIREVRFVCGFNEDSEEKIKTHNQN